MQVVKGGGERDLDVYFKIVKIVESIKTGTFSAIDKCTMIFIAVIPN
jgi:hypothetical protein